MYHKQNQKIDTAIQKFKKFIIFGKEIQKMSLSGWIYSNINIVIIITI